MVPDPPHDVATAHRRTKNKRKMNDLTVVETPANGDRLKAMVFDSVSSPIMKRVYNMALEEFWHGSGRRTSSSSMSAGALWIWSANTLGFVPGLCRTR